jgi:Prokaryotic E2 family E
MKNPVRTIAEIELLSTHYGNVCFDQDDPSVVLIEQFPLPPGYNRRSCELVIDLGKSYPELSPQDWYINRGLRKYGRSISHYYENGFSGKKFCEDGYAWCSFHLKGWRPHPYSVITGDNLLTATDSFYHFLKTD